MLELRPSCELCGKCLPNDSPEAQICTFECTFCYDCAKNVLKNVCPNCGGGFEKRPTRPKHHLDKHPVSTEVVEKKLDAKNFNELITRFSDIPPEKR